MPTKPYKGLGMEGWMARWYARNTGKDFQEFRDLGARIAEKLPPGSRILEVAPGPGYLAIDLAAREKYRITGLDISRAFVAIARENARQAGVNVDFRHGDVAHMPFDNDAFDFLVCRAAFKNFSEPVEAIREMHRVLAPGGTALIIDLRSDAPQSSIDSEVDKMGMGRVNARLTKWIFRFMLLKRAYARDQFSKFIAATPFERFDIQETPIGFDVWLWK